MWFLNIDGPQVVWLLAITFASHALLLLLSRWISPLYLLAAAFMLLAPFSQAREAAGIIVALKWGRVYCTFLMFAMALFIFLSRAKHLGTVGSLFTLFIAFFLLGSLWSDYPAAALAYKGNIALLMVAGVLIPASASSYDELQHGIRVLLGGASTWAIFLLPAMIGGGIGNERFFAYGINPNGIAGLSAFGFIISLAIALYDRWTLKPIAYGSALILFVAVALTGSRAGFGALVLGALVLLAPLSRRPITFVLFSILVAVSAMFLIDLLAHSEGAERLLNTETDSRAGVWRYSFERWSESPVLGHGWLSTVSLNTGAHISYHTHSMYLQVLVDVGVVGCVLFLIVLGVLVWKWLRLWVYLSAMPYEHRGLVYVGTAWTISSLGLGLFETAPLGGSNIAALLFAASMGMVDRIWSLLRQPSHEGDETPLSTFSGNWEPAPEYLAR